MVRRIDNILSNMWL